MPQKSASSRSPKKANPSRGAALRLQRLLASAGFGSRRQCEELIEAGRVHVDGEIITRLGTSVDPEVNKVDVDGVPLKKQKLVYYAVNKPVGVVTTNRDPHGRPRVVDLVPKSERVFPVGRLDRSSEGLILLTNDGELAQKLSHPKFGVKKIYRVTVAGKVQSETMRQMRKGIYIAEGFVRVDGAKLLKSRGRATELEIILREGKNREIRRILARLGHKVLQLRRIAVGPLRLGDVPPGAYRVVSREEVKKLWRATETSTDAASEQRRVKKKRTGKRPAAQRTTKTQAKQTAGEQPAAGKQSSVQRRTQHNELPRLDVGIDGSLTSGSIIGGDPETQPQETPQRKARPDKPGRNKRAGKRTNSKRQTTPPAAVSARGGSRKKSKPATRKSSARKRKRKH